MKFVCDSCHAQYMISDDKVGPNGVKVRCKKCSNVIVVKKMAEPDPTQVMQNPLATDAGQQPKGQDGMFGGIDLDEIGQAFDSVLSSPGLGPKTDATKTPDSSEESTQTGNLPMAAAGAGDPNVDRESTTVMNLKDLTALAAKTEERTSVSALPDGLKAAAVLEQQKKNEVNGHANGVNGTNGKTNGAANGEIPQTDWYIAIDDEQKGPVTLDFVKKAWEEGKVSTDSLVWRNGYGDWRPLSTVPELVKVLTPIPVPRKSSVPPSKQADEEKPAGATATGSQTPWSPGSAPEPAKSPAVPDPDEVDWKPAAASALASLVQEEMAALTKPTPKKTEEPVGVGEGGTRPRAKGLLDMPEEPVPSKSALAEEPAAPKGALDSIPSLPSMPAAEEKPEPRLAEQRGRPAPTARPEPASQPSVEIPVLKPNLPAARPPVDSQRMEVPVYPPPATYVPPAPQPPPSNAKYVVIGGGVLAVCLTIVVVAWMFKTPAPVQPAQPTQPVQVADNRQPPAQPTLAQPAQPVPHPQPVQPTQPVAQPAQPVAQPAQPVVAQPTQPAQPVAQPTQPVAQPAQPAAQPAQPAVKAAPPAAEEEEEEAPAGGGKHHKKKKKHKGDKSEEEVVASNKQPEPAKQAEPAAASGDPDPLSGTKPSKVDDDFNRLLGGGGSKAEEKKPEKKGKDVYIPPAIDNLPKQLGQSDIMGVVVSHKDVIKGCVAKQKAQDPESSGTVFMHWQIEKSGAVSGVKCNTDEFKSSAMAKCMASEIKAWKFGQFSGNPMPIDFPFKF